MSTIHPFTDRRLCIASLVVCGMFVTEDPAIAALRSHESGTSQHRMVLDGALALFMIAYNFACSRYVVAATSSAHMLDAIAEVDARSANRVAASRSRAVRLLRSSFHHLNPFGLIKMAGDRLSRSISRATSSARLRRFGRLTSVLEDLGAVSVLGVPGAGLALGTHGHRATRWRSLRHSALFTASWFVGARLIGWTVRGARIVPYAGVVVTAFTRFVCATFQLLTDVTSPVGAITLLAVAVAVVRYALAVERAIAAAAGAVPNSSACRSDVMVLSLVGAGAAGA